MGIIRSFVDEGKTGTTIKCRKGLQELLRLVASGAANFKQVLVYHVSRWGRFPDSDEAAHYEFLCKQAGIAVHYCAEQFDNDNSTTSNLLKALKRVMASEYSRELSVKIGTAQHRLMAMGFWQGGPAPFGMFRQLVSETRERKQILKSGEWRNIITDRVVLTPGPQEDIETSSASVYECFSSDFITPHARMWNSALPPDSAWRTCALGEKPVGALMESFGASASQVREAKPLKRW